MKKVLLIGGAGFIGFNIAKYLVNERNYKITIADSFFRTGGKVDKEFDDFISKNKIQLISGDFTESKSFKKLDKNYDYICHIDSDAMFVNYIDLNKELENCDLAGPFIYIENGYYIHTGLFFINVKTVLNFKDINWSNTKGTDTGSDIYNFIKNNPQYKIKKLGHYDGYSENYAICNGHTIVSLDIPDINDDFYKLIDVWFNGNVLHFRGGSCFGVGCNKHRTNDRLFFYKKKMEAFTKNIAD